MNLCNKMTSADKKVVASQQIASIASFVETALCYEELFSSLAQKGVKNSVSFINNKFFKDNKFLEKELEEVTKKYMEQMKPEERNFMYAWLNEHIIKDTDYKIIYDDGIPNIVWDKKYTYGFTALSKGWHQLKITNWMLRDEYGHIENTHDSDGIIKCLTPEESRKILKLHKLPSCETEHFGGHTFFDDNADGKTKPFGTYMKYDNDKKITIGLDYITVLLKDPKYYEPLMKELNEIEGLLSSLLTEL